MIGIGVSILDPMKLLTHITEAVGDTPLVQLQSVVPDGAGLVAAKIEYLNPGGSSKDRIAKKIIDAAERWLPKSADTSASLFAPTKWEKTKLMSFVPTVLKSSSARRP